MMQHCDCLGLHHKWCPEAGIDEHNGIRTGDTVMFWGQPHVVLFMRHNGLFGVEVLLRQRGRFDSRWWSAADVTPIDNAERKAA